MENQNTVQFFDNQLIQVEVCNSLVLAGFQNTTEAIAIKHLCENLGISWDYQLKSIKSDKHLSQLYFEAKVKANDSKNRDMICFSPEGLQSWLWQIPITDNLNMLLLEEYKQNLVWKLVNMLRYSMAEYMKVKQELEVYKTREEEGKNRTINYIRKVEHASNLKRESDLLYKEAKTDKEGLLNFYNTDPNQLMLEV